MPALQSAAYLVSLFVRLISQQSAVLFLSEQTSHQQSASSTVLSKQISTSHQQNEQGGSSDAVEMETTFHPILQWLKSGGSRVLIKFVRSLHSVSPSIFISPCAQLFCFSFF
jgi:hypothetical protein